MTDTDRIGHEAEGRIVQALGDAKDAIDGGARPNDAIFKSAAAYGLPAGHVRLMVQAYNTAQTNRTRKDHDDVIEKAGEFELADAADVLSRLYPKVVKSAAALHDETAVDAEYGRPPDWFKGLRSRAAAARGVTTVKAASYGRDPARLDGRAVSVMDAARREGEGLRRRVSEQRDKLAAHFGALEDYFRSPGCLPLDLVRGNSVALFGKGAADLFGQVALSRRSFSKEATAAPAGDPGVDARRAPYSHVAGCLEAVAAHRLAKQARAAHEAAAEPLLRRVAGHFVRPAAHGRIDLDSPDLAVKCAADAGGGGGGGWLSRAVGGAMSSTTGQGIQERLGGPDKDKLKTDAYRAVTDPGHESRLRQLQAQASLHDMMANDPVISGHQPQDVLRVYNEVSQMAPRSAQSPALMRALIRKHLSQGQLDSFDLSQLSGIEVNLKKQRTPDREDNVLPVPGVKGK